MRLNPCSSISCSVLLGQLPRLGFWMCCSGKGAGRAAQSSASTGNGWQGREDGTAKGVCVGACRRQGRIPTPASPPGDDQAACTQGRPWTGRRRPTHKARVAYVGCALDDLCGQHDGVAAPAPRHHILPALHVEARQVPAPRLLLLQLLLHLVPAGGSECAHVCACVAHVCVVHLAGGWMRHVLRALPRAAPAARPAPSSAASQAAQSGRQRSQAGPGLT